MSRQGPGGGGKDWMRTTVLATGEAVGLVRGRDSREVQDFTKINHENKTRHSPSFQK